MCMFAASFATDTESYLFTRMNQQKCIKKCARCKVDCEACAVAAITCMFRREETNAHKKF